ncbi:MAG: endonuclease/exonuclease/phosphatase family protein [Ilumatobacteraceae bacterium]
MRLRIATWNLNTWINKTRKKILNEQLWAWALNNIPSDVYIFTEAQTPPPERVTRAGWSAVHRPGGFPNVSGWGTLIAVAPDSGLQLQHLTHLEGPKPYALDSHFPGSLTAARLRAGDRDIAIVVGLYLPYRKDEQKRFIGHPSYDLSLIRADIDAIVATSDAPLIVAGDLNYDYADVPSSLDLLGSQSVQLVDPFTKQNPLTFQQDWAPRRRFKLDYIYLSRSLASTVIGQRGGVDDFPTAFTVSDHAPLHLTLKL